MIRIIIFFFLMVNTLCNFQRPELSEVRTLYLEAVEEQSAAKELLNILEDNKMEPVLLGYSGAGNMFMAKHVGNPFSKMSHFKKGKEKFSAAIVKEPENIELRFLRFAVQAEAPVFLGYQDNLEEDKQLLLKNVIELRDEQLKKMILRYLLASEDLTEQEKAGLIRRNQKK